MQRAFDRLDRQENQSQWKWTAGFTAACWFLILALIVLTSNSSTVSTWISDAAQAEFAGTMAPEQAPVQTAQPAKHIQTVRVY